MKTAISIPQKLFESGEEFARRQGMSRSALYEIALRSYLQEHRGEVITERLDDIYGVEPGGLDPDIVRLQAQSLPKVDW